MKICLMVFFLALQSKAIGIESNISRDFRAPTRHQFFLSFANTHLPGLSTLKQDTSHDCGKRPIQQIPSIIAAIAILTISFMFFSKPVVF